MNGLLKKGKKDATYSQPNQSLKRYFEILWVVVERSLSARYRGSSLGIYWSMFNPMITTATYTAIFGAQFKSYYGDSLLNYILAVFTGLVMMQFFSASTSQALSSIVGNGGLLNKVRLPISIFPVSAIAANLFQFGVAILPVLLIMTVIRSHFNILNVLALPLPVIALSMVCAGVGLMMSALYVFFRDLPYFYEIVTFFLFISTPVFYPAEIVEGRIRNLMSLNPMAPVIESIRQISLSGQPPDLMILFGSFLSGIILLAIGWVCFRNWRNSFMDLL